jgi:hypothetical protein
MCSSRCRRIVIGLNPSSRAVGQLVTDEENRLSMAGEISAERRGYAVPRPAQKRPSYAALSRRVTSLMLGVIGLNCWF